MESAKGESFVRASQEHNLAAVAEPRVEETSGSVKISADGLTLEFRGARVTRSGQTVTVTLKKVES